MLIREMLLKRTGTIHLEFGRPPPPPPQPRGSASGVTGRNARARSSSSRSWSRGNGAASSSAAHGSDDGPVGTARQRSSNSSNSSRSRSNGAAPSSAARGSNDGHVGTARQSRVAAAPAVLTRRRKTGREEPEQRQDASPSRQQHQLYNRVNSGRVTSSSSAERAAVAALAFLAGTTDPPSTATITAKPLSIRKRRRGSTAAKVRHRVVSCRMVDWRAGGWLLCLPLHTQRRGDRKPPSLSGLHWSPVETPCTYILVCMYIHTAFVLILRFFPWIERGT